MLDSYESERGSMSSLYESLFNRVFEVPSLLTDPSDHNRQRLHSLVEVFVCRQIMDVDVAVYLWLMKAHMTSDHDSEWGEDLARKINYSPFCLQTYYQYLVQAAKKDKADWVDERRIILGLRNFIQFLTLHSWGNPKRLISLFEHFTKAVSEIDWRQKKLVSEISLPCAETKFVLQFGLVDQQRIMLASNLYVQLYHDMGRMLAGSGDKVVVSTMAALQYILKFHRNAFSRYHLEQMSVVLSTHRSPEVNNMIDILMSRVLRPMIRRIRNSHYRYRFNSDYEQELRYISKVSDIESAAFNFSLDATAGVKRHYEYLIEKEINSESNRLGNTQSKLDRALCIVAPSIILGDLFFLEQSHIQAHVHYQKAVEVLDSCIADNRVRLSHFYIEALLRIGELYEHRQRYGRAANVYLAAREAARKYATELTKVFKIDGRDKKRLHINDSKWDILRQPFWAYWYVQLKKSPVKCQGMLPPVADIPMFKHNDPVHCYRAGQLAFFYGCYDTAKDKFIGAIKCHDMNDNTEKAGFIIAYALLNLAENQFLTLFSDKDDPRVTAKECILEMKPVSNLEELESQFRQEDLNTHNFVTSSGKISTQNMLAMMIFSANRLSAQGLHYHAAFAYIRALAIWGMLVEIYRLEGNLLPPSTGLQEAHVLSYIENILTGAMTWVQELRVKAADEIDKLHSGGFDRLQARWVSRDIKIHYSDDVHDENFKPKNPSALDLVMRDEWQKGYIKDYISQKALEKQNKLLMSKAHGINLKNVIDILFGDEDKSVADKDESVFLQRSILGQKLVNISMWTYQSMKQEAVNINQMNLVPHSTRSLIFFHWAAGRKFQYESVDMINQTLSKSEYLKLYDDAAFSIHNLYKVRYYTGHLNSDDRDIMFPLPAMVMYDLWKVLYCLVKYEVDIKSISFSDAVSIATNELTSSTLRRNDTPASLYNYDNVRLRTSELLKNIGRISDVSSNTRAGAIKNRYYLSDDYEDPRFHLDWTLAHMYGSIAPSMANDMDEADKNLRK